MQWKHGLPAWVLASLLVSRLPVCAATRVVDSKSPAASDSNPGTRARPFKTISAAARSVRPGDTVLVRPGIYREAVHLTISGSEGKPITFRSEVPYAAILEGADTIREFQPESAGVWSFAAPGLIALGSDPNAGEWIPAEQVYVSDVPLERVTQKSALIPGTFLLDYDRKRVLVAPLENQDIGKAQVLFSVRGGLIAAEQPLNDIHITGFTLRHNNDWFGSLHALTICGQRWQVENNHIFWSSYAGIAFRHSNHCVVRNNLIDWSGAENVVGNSTANLLFENNRLLHGNWKRQGPDFEGGALKMVSTYDSMYRNNEAAYFYGYGLWFDIGCGDNVFQSNTVHDSRYGGSLFAEISWRVQFLDNIIYNTAFGLQPGETSECTLRRNMVFNNDWGVYLRDDGHRRTATEYGRQSVESYKKNILADIPGLTAERVERLGADYDKYWVQPENFQVAYTDFSDNLVFNNGIGYTEHRRYGQPSDLAVAIHDNTSDNNIFWSPSPGNLFGYESGNYTGLTDWQQATGRDAHSLYADPLAPATPLPRWAMAQTQTMGLETAPPQRNQRPAPDTCPVAERGGSGRQAFAFFGFAGRCGARPGGESVRLHAGRQADAGLLDAAHRGTSPGALERRDGCGRCGGRLWEQNAAAHRRRSYEPDGGLYSYVCAGGRQCHHRSRVRTVNRRKYDYHTFGAGSGNAFRSASWAGGGYFSDTGLVVLEDLLDPNWIAEVRSAYNAALEARIAVHGLEAVQQTPMEKNHLSFYPALVPPFSDLRLIANPIAVQIAEVLLGENFQCTYYHSNTSYPGSGTQNIHRDSGHLFGTAFPFALPAACLALNVPLCDFTEANGSTEVWPGTHLMVDRDSADGGRLAERAAEMPSLRTNIPAGSLVLRDMRMWHRGMPNTTDMARTMLALIYRRNWLADSATLNIPHSTWEGWTEAARKIFRGNKIVSDAEADSA